MPNIGPGELLVVLLIALLVFGPRKLPELGKSLGHGLREFRKSTGAVGEELRRGLETTPDVPAPVPVLSPVGRAGKTPQPEAAPVDPPHS
ncbi:twin-arginine translocase TatA/TatE family subunit [Deinococcus planocerae]|uniref:twin-arginine translocase TatA/TatE family subunit n=1 Tax=Deinococcus planocerae TaxID=1737569 RepID=UPI000C7EC022|nr:twin-arginine translocase TatA/TatE family subunit [Deinococcus planocerae]